MQKGVQYGAETHTNRKQQKQLTVGSACPHPGRQAAGQGEAPDPEKPDMGTGTVKRRRRPIHLHVMVTPEELDTIRQRMAEAGVTNAGAYMRKMALNGYVLHVDLAPVRELVSLQRQCSNNLNQVAIHANTVGVYPEEIAGLQRDYTELWGKVSSVLEHLAEVVKL